MTEPDQLNVTADERGIVRVFSLEMPPEKARFQAEPGAAAESLGVQALDPAHVEIICLSDLDEIGLSGYLTEGCGVPETEIAPVANRLDTLEGYVMVVFSQAFTTTPIALKPAPDVKPVAAFGTARTDWSATAMSAESAKPFSAPRRSPREDRAISRRVGARVFTIFWIIIALIVLLVILL